MAKFKFKKAGLQEYAGLAAGAVAASKVANIKLPVALPPVVQSALPLILGVMLAKKPGFIGAIGKGMIAVGGTKVIAAVAPQLGIGLAAEGMGDFMIEGADTYALAGAEGGSGVGNTSYALAGLGNQVDRPDGGSNFG